MDDDRGISGDLEDRFQKRRQGGHNGTLLLSDDEAYVGDTITLEGRNLPENTPLDVIWKSAKGYWGVLKGNDIVGPQFQHLAEQIKSVSTDGSGAVSEELVIPEDFGGEHTIELQTTGEETVAEATITITPWFELDRSRAPLGETFTITGYGLGPNYITNNYQVTWDNTMVGFMTGQANRGTSTASIRAVGPVGDHVVQIWRNFHGTPFLQNNTQSPFGPVAGGRRSSWTVEVREPDSELPPAWMDDLVDESPLNVHIMEPDLETDAKLSITPPSGQPGIDAFIEGDHFPAETEVNLVWYTHEGHHIKGSGITAEPRPDLLPTVTTDSDGTFQTEITIPSDVGSTRPIAANVGGESVATTGFMMQPAIEKMAPEKGPVGTDIEFELSGLGWTMFDTAYFFVYDNQRVGYVCGSDNDGGVVRTVLKAAGEPGMHFIDVYPGFFKTEEEKPDFTLKPHLSYADNHPVRPLPAFHFTFEVTE